MSERFKVTKAREGGATEKDEEASFGRLLPTRPKGKCKF